MPTATSLSLTDEEFGTINIRRVRGGRYVRLRVNADGRVSASLPMRAPVSLVGELLEKSRASLRRSLQKQSQKKLIFTHGSRIGASHSLSVITAPRIVIRLRSPHVLLAAPAETDIGSAAMQQLLKPYIEKALRTEAKAYLPRRLRYFADMYGFSYQKIRFSNAGTRWGSCSSTGTISLNIWLMQLEPDIRDYVMVHELCHTREMNHSKLFWSHVESIIPEYRARRKTLKEFQPQM